MLTGFFEVRSILRKVITDEAINSESKDRLVHCSVVCWNPNGELSCFIDQVVSVAPAT